MITKPVEIITKRPWLSASIITFILLVSSCRFYERQHRKNYAPKGISVGQTLIYAPGCYIWACGGGSVFKLPKRTREKIEAGGLDYLNSLAGFGKNKRPIGKWGFRLSKPEVEEKGLKYQFFPMWLDKRVKLTKTDKEQMRKFRESIKNHGFYVSSRRSEPIIIISTEAEMIYIGWWD